jgi:NADH:ubiquinone oxidoreductase subunit 5 (subunit L)/multisubunit Na+/H+ antiporter MnhA subunit
MSEFLQLFIWLPLAGMIISLFIPKKRESLLSGLAISTTALHLAGILALITYWLANGYPVLDIKHAVLFRSGNIEIFIDFYFDKVTAMFCLVGSFVAFLVTIFSRYYMHREPGFKRFFITILFFFLGYNLVIFSGNFETLFVGWEILGICSFLLIAFYRDRYLPVKNGLKVISIYRLADVCLLLAMWMSHHLWHENITFLKLHNTGLVETHVQQHYTLAAFIAIMILLASVIKSAQLPFSSWLPRAMEGPTTSSAIFYGSLSVHLGVFVLLRTAPFWESVPLVKVLIIVIGLATALVATGIARVQSTVKTQIAYSSAAQIGIIFIEVGLGFHVLALIHFAGNAFLRTYQLLVSPSVLSYLTHDQFYNFTPRNPEEKLSTFKRISNSFYILCIKEWNMDSVMYRVLWSPFKWIGGKFEFVTRNIAIALIGFLFLFGLFCFWYDVKIASSAWLPYVFASLALILILCAFTNRRDAIRSWLLVFASQFFVALSIGLNKQFEFTQILLYLSGGTVAALIGYTCLHKIKAIDQDIDLNRFHGYVYERPTLALVFLFCCLGMVAFPITPAFIGFDILLTHIHEEQFLLIILMALSFIFIELSVLRIYARIFLGQHKKADHAMAYRSS